MILRIMQFYIPGFIKKRKLDELFRLTAHAFQCEPPQLGRLSFADRLSRFALFTKEQAEKYVKAGRPLDEVKDRLYQNSRIFGQSLRRSLNVVSWEEAAKVMQVIYKLIGIEFHYCSQGEIVIKQCSFSKYYSAEVCMLMSSLDEGLAAGLSNGGRLCFQHRITEGGSCCTGYFSRGL